MVHHRGPHIGGYRMSESDEVLFEAARDARAAEKAAGQAEADAAAAHDAADEAADALEGLLTPPPDDPPPPAGKAYIIRDTTIGQFVGGVVTKRPTKAVLAALVKATPTHVFVVVEVEVEV